MDISRRSFMDSYWGNLPGIPAVSAIEVRTEAQADVIVCFGDSITQQSTWTLPLARMLNENGHKAVVLNAGIGGNRLLLGPPEPALQVFGPAAIQRFERDVLGVTGVTSVIFALGTNDIGWIRKTEDMETAGANAVFSGLKLLAEKAHARKISVYAATLTPRGGSLDYSPEQERERLRLNEMIRNADCFDKVIDFAEAAADTDNSGILAPHCDSGDHLHPSALGGLQMARTASAVIANRQD
jgi:lysophospholipase L1-like esterase